MRTGLYVANILFAIAISAVAPTVSSAQASATDDPAETPSVASSADSFARAPASLASMDLATQSRQAAREVTVEELQQLALERNTDLLAAREEVGAARGFLTQTRLRPNPGLDVSVGNGRPLGSAVERRIDIGYAHTFELAAKRARRIDVGRVGVEVAELLVADRERLLIAEVKGRFAAAIAAARNLETLGELAEMTGRVYRVAQQREGKAVPLQRALLLVELARLSADRLLTAGAGARAVAELKLAAGLDLTELLGLRGGPRVPPVSLSLEEAMARALAERPDLKAARADEGRANAQLQLSHAEHVPDVIGIARYGRIESQFPQLGTSSTGQLVPIRDTDHVLTLGVSIALPFSNRNQGHIESSAARQNAARLRRQFIEQSIRTEVTAAYTQYVAALRALETFGQEAVKQAQEGVSSLRTSYESGEVELLEVLQEHRRLLDTQNAYTQMLKDHYVARAALEAAVSAELR